MGGENMSNKVYISFLRMPILIRILLMAMLVFLIFGISIHFLEPKTFPTIFDGIWWAIITASTVGYGDYVPHSFYGRITALILILLGAGLVSSYFGTLAATAVTTQNAFFEGKIPFKGKGHIIIIGWNERSKGLIHSLIEFPQMVVLIDETLATNPINSNYVHFIQGKGHVDETIIKSDIVNAERVLITADRGNDELQADMNSILTLLTIKGLCSDVKCIVEILTAEQVINAYRAGADEVIQSNKLTSVFMIHSLHSNGGGLLSNVVHQLQERRFSSRSVDEALVGKTFGECHQELTVKGFLLFGVKRGEDIVLNPSHSILIEKNDKLLLFK
jgi:voltage-gated potassium channel